MASIMTGTRRIFPDGAFVTFGLIVHATVHIHVHEEEGERKKKPSQKMVKC